MDTVNKKVASPQFKWKLTRDGDELNIKVYEKSGTEVIAEATSTLIYSDMFELEFDDLKDTEFFEKLANTFDYIVKIDWLKVEPEKQRLGIAKRLLSLLLTKIVQSNPPNTPIYLNASPTGGGKGLTLPDLVSFYKKFGFQTIEEYGNNTTMWVINPKVSSVEQAYGQLITAAVRKMKRYQIEAPVYRFEKEYYDDFQSVEKFKPHMLEDLLNFGKDRTGYQYTWLPSRIKLFIERFGNPEWIYLLRASKSQGATLHALYFQQGKNMIRVWQRHTVYESYPLDQFIGQAQEAGYTVRDFDKGNINYILHPQKDLKIESVTSKINLYSEMPEGDLKDFYELCRADEWEQEAREEALEHWEDLSEDEKLEEYNNLKYEGYVDLEPKNYNKLTKEQKLEMLKDYFVSVYVRDAQEHEGVSTETFFSEPTIGKNVKLVRFTDVPPDKFAGFTEGYGPKNLGLTVHYTPRKDGDLLFAFALKDLKTKKDFKYAADTYGKYGYMFTAKWAVRAYHNTDDEYQVVFDINEVVGEPKLIWPEEGKATSGIEDKDYPYFHVSNYPKKPTVPELNQISKKLQKRAEIDLVGLYLFPKNTEVNQLGWANAKYRWDAKLKKGVNELDLNDANQLDSVLAKAKIDLEAVIRNLYSFNVSYSFYTDRIKELYGELNKIFPEAKNAQQLAMAIQLADPDKQAKVQEVLDTWLEWTENKWALLVTHFRDSSKLTKFIKSLGYNVASDHTGETVLYGEPQVIVLDPDLIEWHKREINQPDDKVYKLNVDR